MPNDEMTVFDEVESISSTDKSGIFPTLSAYQKARTDENFHKVCVELADFCIALYASTQNDKQREIYRAIMAKTIK